METEALNSSEHSLQFVENIISRFLILPFGEEQTMTLFAFVAFVFGSALGVSILLKFRIKMRVFLLTISLILFFTSGKLYNHSLTWPNEPSNINFIYSFFVLLFISLGFLMSAPTLLAPKPENNNPP
ncbi:hypothetical protein FMN50_20710 [Rhodobacterales bacterium]|nr:hypothetical protein FMN50_20710 [Rhodobacterales bacterium]